MSTDQITGRNGQLQYGPDNDYEEPAEGGFRCESCGKIRDEAEEIHLARYKGKFTLCICGECFDKKYEFYIDGENYFINY
jgi:hypothetical protein